MLKLFWGTKCVACVMFDRASQRLEKKEGAFIFPSIRSTIELQKRCRLCVTTTCTAQGARFPSALPRRRGASPRLCKQFPSEQRLVRL